MTGTTTFERGKHPSRPLDALDESERNHVLVSIARKIADAVEL